MKSSFSTRRSFRWYESRSEQETNCLSQNLFKFLSSWTTEKKTKMCVDENLCDPESQIGQTTGRRAENIRAVEEEEERKKLKRGFH